MHLLSSKAVEDEPSSHLKNRCDVLKVRIDSHSIGSQLTGKQGIAPLTFSWQRLNEGSHKHFLTPQKMIITNSGVWD